MARAARRALVVARNTPVDQIGSMKLPASPASRNPGPTSRRGRYE
jgi:hypothetical protein